MQSLRNVVIGTNAPLAHVETTLEFARHQVQNGRIAPALDDLFEDLKARRDEEPESWSSFARPCHERPIRGLLPQDPFTYRAFSKPRGYAGDAVMMDYIYGLGEAEQAARET